MDGTQIVIGLATVELYIAYSHSLKTKRRLVKSVLTRLHNQFNLAAAEVGYLDRPQQALLGLVCISNDHRYAEGLLQKALNALEAWRVDAEIVNTQIEML